MKAMPPTGAPCEIFLSPVYTVPYSPPENSPMPNEKSPPATFRAAEAGGVRRGTRRRATLCSWWYATVGGWGVLIVGG